MNKITIILKESGTTAELRKNFKIYRGSALNVLLNILVPKSIVEGKLCTQYVSAKGDISTENGVYTAVKIGETYVNSDGRLGKTQSYYVRYLKDIETSSGVYQVYERLFPSEFALVDGTGINAPKLVVNVENILNNITQSESGSAIINEPTIISLITSQECPIDIEPSTALDTDPASDPTEFDLLSGQVNDVVQQVNAKANIKDAVLKYNLLEELPNTIMYSKDGYKTVGVHFYNETYNVPVNATEKEDKVGEVFVTNMRPHETELYQAYQDETFSFDTGTVKRTILINTVQQDIGQYSVISVGEWKTVGVEYLDALQEEISVNQDEINSLKGRAPKYTVHLGDNTNPTQEELNEAFQEESGLEVPVDGTTLIDLDNNKEYTYFETSGQWVDRGTSTVSPFTNTASGVIKGSTQDGYVGAVNGQGKVQGWETVKNDIEQNKTDIAARMKKEDFSKIAVNKTISSGSNSAIETTTYKNASDNSETTEQAVLEGTDNNINVSVEDNKIKLKVDAEGVSVVHNISLNNETPIEPNENKTINIPSFQREDAENNIEGRAGVVTKEQAEQIAFKEDAEAIANTAVATEKTRAEQAESELSSRITTNAEDIAENAQEIAQIKTDYVPKTNVKTTTITDESFSVSETGALQQTQAEIDLTTGTQTTKQKVAIPVVNGQARLFLPQEQETLQDLESWHQSMTGEALSWQTDLSGIPSGDTSSSEVQTFLSQKYYEVVGKTVEPLDQTTLSDENLGVTYKWYTNDNAWILSHGSPSAIATNNMYAEDGSVTSYGNTGTIVGSNKKFHVLVETNGEGAVNGLDALEEQVNDNTSDISKEITDRQNAITNETTRAQQAEQANSTAIATEKTRAEGVEANLNTAINNEISRAQQAEQANASAISAETTRAQQAEQANATEIAKKANSSTTVAGKPLTSNVTLGDLNIKRNGTPLGTYNGESDKEIDIDVPTSTSELTNNGDGTQVNGNVDPYAKVSQIPTNNKQLTNGANYATKTEVNTRVPTAVASGGYTCYINNNGHSLELILGQGSTRVAEITLDSTGVSIETSGSIKLNGGTISYDAETDTFEI